MIIFLFQLLAVVYETFTSIEREKFRKLFLHKREASRRAFRLLVSKQNPESVRFKQFLGLMKYYEPRKSNLDVLLMFKQLNTSSSGALNVDEFITVYDSVTLHWSPKDPPQPWYFTAWKPIQIICKGARKLIFWPYFEHIVCKSILICNGNVILM